MRLFMLLIFWTISYSLFAQDKTQTPKKKFISRTQREAGINIASNGSMSALSLQAAQYWGLGKKKKKFQIGLGARLTSSFGAGSLDYITAPAILTSGKTGPGVFFTENIPNNIDSVSLNGTQINALNVYFMLHYNLHKKLAVEFNIDLVGFSFGGTKKAILNYGDAPINKGVHNSEAKPTTGNVLLISDNDIGSLNSEFMFIYKLNHKLKINAGPSFLFNEYTLSDTKNYNNTLGTNINNTRFRTKALMIGVGVRIKI